MKSENKIIKAIKSEILMFLRDPIPYVYMYTYSNKKIVDIRPYNPMTTQLGLDIKNKINSLFPELRVHFLGSAALKIAGQLDVDIFVECDKKHFNKYIPAFTKLFGEPSKKRNKFIMWEFKKNDIDVQLLLVDQTSRILKRPLKGFADLSKHTEEYQLLKLRSVGCTHREYEKRKIKFLREKKLV